MEQCVVCTAGDKSQCLSLALCDFDSSLCTFRSPFQTPCPPLVQSPFVLQEVQNARSISLIGRVRSVSLSG